MIEPFIGTGVFLLLGLGMIICALWAMSYEKRFLSKDVSVTKGKIIEIRKHTNMDNGKACVYYTASVEYWAKGEIHRISGTDRCLKQYIYVDKNAYKPGDIVEIAYRNDQTNDCIIKGNKHDKKAIFIVLFGIVFIIIALIILFTSL